ncbi:MAG: bifunctional 4-hydroxy-2-oxoglutarate aldolase/2-dehydro-3-deoxy-phosphogluconate aldolase [Clostridiales bacterium]|nr:bifunctional 4-hydroxy-2-oxoglutarate aldolase/2-dehydro-3-deoxy-phosphogluconate aldolase [Clostridiales bacterium]
MDVFQKISECKVVPVVAISDARLAVPAAKALLAGGITTMEVTFRTDCAADAIRAIAEEVPEMLVGAGTVLNEDHALKAWAAGARFLVSPGYDEDLVDFCLEQEFPIIPGCVTPTEIMRALSRNLSILKFFPANIYGGVNAIKSLSSVFRDVKFVPTGGIGPDDLEEYLSLPSVFAVGGSWLCSESDISAGRFDRITELAAQAACTT